MSSEFCPYVDASIEHKLVFDMYRAYMANLMTIPDTPGWLWDAIMVIESVYNEIQNEEVRRWQELR